MGRARVISREDARICEERKSQHKGGEGTSEHLSKAGVVEAYSWVAHPFIIPGVVSIDSKLIIANWSKFIIS